MARAVRILLFITAFLVITALYAVSKEVFPPTALSGGIRGLVACVLFYIAWLAIKRIDFGKKSRNSNQ